MPQDTNPNKEQVIQDALQLSRRFLPLMGGGVYGPRVPVPKPQGKSLLEAFRPWGRHIDKAMPHLYGPSQVPGAPDTAGKISNAFDTYRQLLLDMLQRGQ